MARRLLRHGVLERGALGQLVVQLGQVRVGAACSGLARGSILALLGPEFFNVFTIILSIVNSGIVGVFDSQRFTRLM